MPSGRTAGGYFLVTSIGAFGTNDSDPNDTQSSTPFTVTSGPDLVITSVTANATPSNGTVGFGDAVALGFTVENQGGAAAGAFTIQFQYDDDANLSAARQSASTSEPLIATYSVSGGLAAGATLTVNPGDVGAPSGMLPGRVRNGSRFVQALADPDASFNNGTGAVSESDESNNGASTALAITGEPDLIVETLCVVADGDVFADCGPSPTAAQGERVRAYRVVRNQGKAYAQTTQGRFYVSSDATITTSDTPAGSLFGIGALEAGATAPSNGNPQLFSVTLPQSGPTGSVFLGLLVESTSDTESNTANNGASDGIDITGPPNLSLSAFAISTGTASGDGTPSADGNGSTVNVTYTVANTEATASDAFSIRFYFNNAGNTGLGSVLETVSEAALAGNAARMGTATLTLPASVERGLNADGEARGIRYRVDAGGSVAETDEADNDGGALLDVTGRPDLHFPQACLGGASNCAGGSYAAPSVIAGATLSASGTRVGNEGVVRQNGARYRYYYSNDALIDVNSDVQVGETVFNPSADSFASVSTNLTIPAGATPGTRYVGFVADPLGEVTESDEADNVVVLAIEVQSAVNLSVDSWTATDETGSGETIVGSLTVRNSGSGQAPASSARIYYDDDADAGNGQSQIGSVCAVPAIAGGQTASVTCSGTLPASVLFGSRTLRVRLDQPGSVPESDETDNDADAAFQVTGRADLLFSAFSAGSGNPGEQVAVSYTVRNDGASRSDDPFTVVVYYSADMTVDGSDAVLDTQTQSADQNVGSTFTQSVTVTIPGGATPGGFLIGRADDASAIAEADETNNTIASQAVLPVELVAFDAVANETGAILTWETASETNNSGFEVEVRQIDPDAESDDADAAWTTLGWVGGSGTTLEAQSYRFEAPLLSPGTHRFRLRRDDLDGAFEYGPVVELELALTQAFRLDWAGPNPSQGRTALRLHVQQPQHVTATLFDALGRAVAVLHDADATPGSAATLVLDEALPAGTYFVRVAGERFSDTRSVVRVR